MEIIHYQTEDGVDVYQDWVNGLKDARAKISVLRRIDRAAMGNFGDHRACRAGVSEMRIDYGPGFRVYYFQYGKTLEVLLCGGDKHAQDADINRAVAFKADFQRRMKENDHD